MTAGLSQSRMARLAGLSQQQASQAELGAGDVSLEARCRMAAACGHELGWRLYPVATLRLRDSGQLRIAQEIVQAVHRSWQARLEVPVARGDLRAADLVLTSAAEILHVEIERALVDLQAQLRAAQLKRQALAEREGRPIRLVIAVPDTRTTRARLAPLEELLARTLPASSASTWRALRTGEPLGADGILFVRARVRARVRATHRPGTVVGTEATHRG
ncbi:MAG: helix-turn-helix transcriptional regulator [Chloroflexi bacterium]|nr:helix-turn-helix transcriptional regulator [Chloroflexota bacterium]